MVQHTAAFTDTSAHTSPYGDRVPAVRMAITPAPLGTPSAYQLVVTARDARAEAEGTEYDTMTVLRATEVAFGHGEVTPSELGTALDAYTAAREALSTRQQAEGWAITAWLDAQTADLYSLAQNEIDAEAEDFAGTGRAAVMAGGLL